MEQSGDHVHAACRYFRCRYSAGHTASTCPCHAGITTLSSGVPTSAGRTTESSADSSATAASDHPVSCSAECQVLSPE